MPHLALLMLQVASAVPAGALPLGAAGAALLHPVPPAACVGKTDEILVCGKNADTYRLPPRTDVEPAGLPKAEWKLFGNATMGVGTSERTVGGYPSNAVMATIKIPF